jgi:glc operon protein GlcG
MDQRSYITLTQAQAAMNAMLKKAMEQPHRPVAMAIVDDAGILIAYQQMDGLRLFTRRHAIRKAYTAAITGMNSGMFGEHCIKARGQTVREVGGDLELTPGHGGVVVRSSRHTPRNPEGFHVNVMGGIGVGGYLSGREDEELAVVGLEAMGLDE